MCNAYSGCKFLLAHVYCFSGVFDLILKFHKVQPLCKNVATIIALFAGKINPYYGCKSKICFLIFIIPTTMSPFRYIRRIILNVKIKVADEKMLDRSIYLELLFYFRFIKDNVFKRE